MGWFSSLKIFAALGAVTAIALATAAHGWLCWRGASGANALAYRYSWGG
jgi:hypothetical protein